MAARIIHHGLQGGNSRYGTHACDRSSRHICSGRFVDIRQPSSFRFAVLSERAIVAVAICSQRIQERCLACKIRCSRKRRFLLCVSILLGGSWALSGSLVPCHGQDIRKSGTGPPDPSDKTAWNEYIKEGRNSPFGLDYVMILNPEIRTPEVARDFGKTVGVRWVSFTRIQWDRIEPDPPENGKHSYAWQDLDEGVQLWQQYGVHITMTLNMKSRWATAPFKDKTFDYAGGPVKKLMMKPFRWYVQKTYMDNLPKPEHMEDYRTFVRSLVERYDGDGTDDMPGLRYPILYYQVGNEYCNEMFWGSTPENYGILLKEASQSARKANKEVKIMLSGVSFNRPFGLYDSELDPKTKAFVEKHTSKYKEDNPTRRGLKRANDFSMKSLEFCNDFDIVDARDAFYGKVRECRRLLDQLGCRGKEIWAGEALCTYPLLPKQALTPIMAYPYPMPSKSLEYRKILMNPKNKRFEEISGWYRGMQAAQTVKVTMAALHAGASRVLMGYALDKQTKVVSGLGFLTFSGLRSATFEELWPAAHTYGLLIKKLDGFQSCKRLSMPKNVYVYECIVKNGKKVIVAFYDDHIGQNHDEPLGVIQAEIPSSGKYAELTHIIKEVGKTEPVIERLEVKNGKLALALSEYPIFIEPL